MLSIFFLIRFFLCLYSFLNNKRIYHRFFYAAYLLVFIFEHKSLFDITDMEKESSRFVSLLTMDLGLDLLAPFYEGYQGACGNLSTQQLLSKEDMILGTAILTSFSACANNEVFCVHSL